MPSHYHWLGVIIFSLWIFCPHVHIVVHSIGGGQYFCHTHLKGSSVWRFRSVEEHAWAVCVIAQRYKNAGISFLAPPSMWKQFWWLIVRAPWAGLPFPEDHKWSFTLLFYHIIMSKPWSHFNSASLSPHFVTFIIPHVLSLLVSCISGIKILKLWLHSFF